MQKKRNFDEILEKHITGLGNIVIKRNVDKLTEEEFADVRHDWFGASDSSKLLDLNPFPRGTLKELIDDKVERFTDPTIGLKGSVRKGKDLEPFVIKKAEELLGIKIEKPTVMYGMPFYGLSVNYDGVHQLAPNVFIPIEIKIVTKWGKKYYDFSKSTNLESPDFNNKMFKLERDIVPYPNVLPENFEPKSEIFETQLAEYHAHISGIPIYYYTQLQQQMLFMQSPFGILIVLDDDEWVMKLFKVDYNPIVALHLRDVALIANIQLYTRRDIALPKEVYELLEKKDL